MRNRYARIVGLVALGGVGVTRGVAYLPSTGPERLASALEAMSDVIPITVWALVWIVAGLVCLASAVWRQHQAAATPIAALATAWAVAYTAAWIGSGWTSRDYLSAALYGCLALLTASWAALTAPTPQEPPS